ncbi:hypothetical protein [Xenorhabdus thuongxuanensis]|uniref:Uncharacterized protein n=1 Tax=Xenorhabdus thuongxuanensis TaxID=1873484 RepID=A0A1Q5TIY8_9GAMM|nr:hypothetical protein [Xenorhabdus thuongxuanensis]OKP00176.1 hypothetical protein Xentx_03559 [Xenorhabdus thuongxuanensis]
MGSVNGIYISEDGQHHLTITGSNDSNGSFSGSFISSPTSGGRLTYNQIIGQYAFVSATNYWPAQIGFSAIFIREPRHYVIADYWNGIRTSDGNLLMSGVRTYTTDAGLYDLYTFEKIRFIIAPTEK